MNEEKLSRDEVPPRFSEWLLAMGCPPEDVPPIEKIAEMCRGHCYMEWRSLMEHVGAKDMILKKRLQVFYNDIVRCQKKNVFNELDVNMPEALSLWRQHSDQKEQVADAEAKLAERKENLNRLVSKISSKLALRNVSRKRLEDLQRRRWLLQQVSAELRESRENHHETKNIADALRCPDHNQDVEGKLDKCLSVISRAATATATTTATISRAGESLLSVANPIACSSLASANGDCEAEEYVASLVRCGGEVVFKQVLERRAGLCAMLTAPPKPEDKQTERHTPQSVLAHAAALQCTVALHTAKNRAHVKHTRKRLAATLNECHNNLSGEACELLVLRCELAYNRARAGALRAAAEGRGELRARTGVFAAARAHPPAIPAYTHIRSVHKSTLSKKDELKRLIVSSAAVESKAQNVREKLEAMFNNLHASKNQRFEGQRTVTNTQDSISTVRQFYEEWREKRKNKGELSSLYLDLSDGCSYNDLTDNESPKLIDELRMYLKKFNLEKNRMLVLESGEKMWIFETVQSSVDRLRSQWQDTTSILCPSVSLHRNLAELTQLVTRKKEMETLVQILEEGRKKQDLPLDITSKEEENKSLDKVKKRLNDNLLSLQKTAKTLDIGMENLRLWSGNMVKQYISENRTVDGRTYKDYERAFMESIRDMIPFSKW